MGIKAGSTLAPDKPIILMFGASSGWDTRKHYLVHWQLSVLCLNGGKNIDMIYDDLSFGIEEILLIIRE